MASPVALTAITRTDHFIIYHAPDQKSTAEVIGENSEYWIRDIAAQLDARDKLNPPIPMFIYRNQGEFRDATGHDRPAMVVGMASSLGTVVLDASGIFAPAEQVAGHEITHIMIFRILGETANAFPLWANEGTAKYMSNDWNQVDRDFLSSAVFDGNLMPLSSISRSFPEGERQELAYAEGTSAIVYFIKTYGEKSLAKLIHETATTGSFDTAMKRVTGRSSDQFEREWRVSIEGKFGLAAILRIARIIVSIALPVLVLAAYFAFRNRRRRIVAQYEQDEWEEANWRDWGNRGF